MEPVSLRAGAGIGWITIDNPPVNALSPGVCAGLADAVERAAADRAIKVIVLRGAGRIWSTGVDIGDLDTAPLLPALCARLAELETPVIAALHGTVLGGALELALCARLRIASPGTQLGFPDVSLGLLPGAGGTQRLPRLVGEAEARRLILSGRVLPGPEALGAGLVDHAVADAELDEFVSDFTSRMAGRPPHAIAAIKRCFLAGRDNMQAGLDRELAETLSLYANAATLELVDRQIARGRSKKSALERT